MKGSRLRHAREKANLRQAELGRAVGLSPSMISALEREDREPSVDTVRQLADVLGVSVAWLLGETVAEDAGTYGPRSLLADYATPPGLRDLAGDHALIEALGITATEWRALRSLELPGAASKDGYLNLLITIRAVCGPGR